MTRKQLSLLAVAVAIVAAGAVITMTLRHSEQGGAAGRVKADMVNTESPLSEGQIDQALREANLPIERLSVRHVGGIVLIRGNGDAASAARAVDVVKGLGFRRVANLVQPITPIDDEALRRDAERQLANNRALDGCMLKVSCERGVLSVSGTVQSELQADVTRSVLRTVRGAQDVKVSLNTRS
jgi:osmotically-inducible protein OsmY